MSNKFCMRMFGFQLHDFFQRKFHVPYMFRPITPDPCLIFCHITTKIFIRCKIIFLSFGTLFTIATAFEEVQMISLIAFYFCRTIDVKITTWSGYFDLNAANASGLHASANEQPARKSGNNTFFPIQNLRRLCHEMNPGKTIIDAFVFSACCANPKLSPI